MHWPSSQAFQPKLPNHCVPTSDFLQRFSSVFHICVPTPLAFISNALGVVSIVSWLFAQLPQIYKNWSISSTSGLSIFFLLEWCLGDLTNLFGALLTHQATWQVAIAAYYVFVDLCLVGQWIWYEKLQYGSHAQPPNHDDRGSAHPPESGTHAAESEDSSAMAAQSLMSVSHPRIIFRTPTFNRLDSDSGEKFSPDTPAQAATLRGTSMYRVGGSSSMPSPSPRTVLLIACLMAVVQASPMSTSASWSLRASNPHEAPSRTTLEVVGTVLSWSSTILYLGSRLPQLIKNWQRKSTAGLSPHLFIAAFSGNLFYSAALATNPCAWSDYGPNGGGGIAGPEGSERTQWITAALPFFLGAAGVLGLDASVGIQFLIYGQKDGEVRLAMVNDTRGQLSHWRRVSGWMRGWIPGKSLARSLHEEQQDLLRGGATYGTM